MDLTISKMTANRQFVKAARRVNGSIEKIEQRFRGTAVSGEPFDNVIITFVDRDREFLEEVLNGDRVYQVNVGLPQGLSFRPADDDELLRAMVEQVRLVLQRSPLRETNKSALLRALLREAA